MPDFSPQNDTFFPGPQIAPVGISDPTFSSRSDYGTYLHYELSYRGLGQLVEFVPKRFAGITIIDDYNRHCLVSRGRLTGAKIYN